MEGASLLPPSASGGAGGGATAATAAPVGPLGLKRYLAHASNSSGLPAISQRVLESKFMTSSDMQSGADRRRRTSKRERQESLWGMLCNPLVWRMITAMARFGYALVEVIFLKQ